MGMIQSMFCSLMFCLERALTWTFVAFMVMLLMLMLVVLTVYGISVGYHYAQKELASYALESRNHAKALLRTEEGSSEFPELSRRYNMVQLTEPSDLQLASIGVYTRSDSNVLQTSEPDYSNRAFRQYSDRPAELTRSRLPTIEADPRGRFKVLHRATLEPDYSDRTDSVETTETNVQLQTMGALYNVKSSEGQIYMNTDLVLEVGSETESSTPNLEAEVKAVSDRNRKFKELYKFPYGMGSTYEYKHPDSPMSMQEQQLARRLIGRIRRSRNNTGSTQSTSKVTKMTFFRRLHTPILPVT